MDRFELVATITNDCLIDWDLVTDKVWRYEGPHGFLGHARDTLRGYRKWWAENAHPEDKVIVLDDFTRAMAEGREIWFHEYRFRGADQNYYPVYEKGKILRDDAGKVIRYIGALRDMTVQRNTENQLISSQQKALAASEAKNRFIASMSHEFRTPLNAVIGFSQLLLEEDIGTQPLGDIQRDYIKRVHSAGKLLLGLVSEILELAAIEQGKVQINRERLDIKPLLLECVAIHDLKLKEKDLTLTCDLDAETPLFIHVDRKHMMQVLSNLIVNAIKYSREGGSIGLFVREEEGQTVFCVTDEGIGIASADQQRIFTDFEQLENGQNRFTSSGGLGLGLSICRKLVELHKGRIWVESEKGRGSQFYFSIPRKRPDAPAPIVFQINDSG